MIAMQRISFFILIGSLLANVACQKSCSKKTEVSKETNVNGKVDIHEPPKSRITSFESLQLDGLTTPQIEALTTLFNEEICPCGCPKSFAQCLTMKEGCAAGKLLAQWTASQLKEGAPETYLFKFVSEEINAGYLAEPVTIDTKNAHHKGNKDAPIVIVEFADFECPACKIASSEMREFIKANANDVQIYFMHFPLSAHPHAEAAAIAAEAAGKLGKFWEMHDLLFSHNGPLTDDAIKNLAKKIFDTHQMAQFEKTLTDPALLQKVKDHREYGMNEIKLMGTPTFYFNGRPYNLSSSREGYQLRLAMEKLRKDINCQAK